MANPKPQVEVVVRLQSDVYKQLEADLPQPIVQSATTEHQVAFNLGIQYVLKKLRDGFTVIRD